MQPEQVVLSWGSVWAQILLAMISFVAPIVAAAVVAVLYKIFCYYGISLDTELKKRLQDHVLNGLNYSAVILAPRIKLGMTQEVKSEMVKIVYEYVKDHGADTLRGLGVSLDDPKLIESVQARIEKLINDSSVSTPPAFSPEDKKPDAIISGTLKTTES